VEIASRTHLSQKLPEDSLAVDKRSLITAPISLPQGGLGR
jgi:hypothetical protein